MGLNVHVIKCDVDPSAAPTHVGQHWINVTTGDQWFANGTSSVANWIKISQSTDEKVKTSINDTTPGFLDPKIQVGGVLTKTIQNPGANETLLLSVPDASIQIINNFGNLPSSPSTGDIVFYSPFNSLITWDGADWAGPKFVWQPFGRRGHGHFPLWLRSVGGSIVNPTGGNPNGVQLPALSEGNAIKIYNIAAKSGSNTSGDLEIHKDATSIIPSFGATGIGKTTFTSGLKSDTQLVTPGVVNAGEEIQCYFRRTSGTWRDLSVTMMIANIARAP